MGMIEVVTKARRKTKSPEARARAKAERIRRYREARAIFAFAAVDGWGENMRAPSYYNIAGMLGFDRKAAEVADEIWNDANGPDEGPETEERALERVVSLLELELD